MSPKESNSDEFSRLVICYLEGSTSISFALKIEQDFSWAVSLRGVGLKRDTCPLLTALPESLTSVSNVCLVTARLSTCHVCVGNMEEKFLKLSNMQKGVFTDASGTCIR